MAAKKPKAPPVKRSQVVPGRNVTSYDVALRAGVSQSAVSRCFKPGASVSSAMRARVMKASRELDYTPNAIARSLITRRSNLVAVLISNLTNLYYPEVLSELSQQFVRKGMRVLLFTLPHEADVDKAISKVWEYQVDGVVAAVRLTLQQVAEFERRRIPLGGQGRPRGPHRHALGRGLRARRRPALRPRRPAHRAQGYPKFEGPGWGGVIVPKATPPELVEKISADIRRALADPAVQQKIIDRGAVADPRDSRQWAEFVKGEIVKVVGGRQARQPQGGLKSQSRIAKRRSIALARGLRFALGSRLGAFAAEPAGPVRKPTPSSRPEGLVDIQRPSDGDQALSEIGVDAPVAHCVRIGVIMKADWSLSLPRPFDLTSR